MLRNTDAVETLMNAVRMADGVANNIPCFARKRALDRAVLRSWDISYGDASFFRLGQDAKIKLLFGRFAGADAEAYQGRVMEALLVRENTLYTLKQNKGTCLYFPA